MYKAYCLLGAFICFALFVIMCYRIHETEKEIEAEIQSIEERTTKPHGTRKDV